MRGVDIVCFVLEIGGFESVLESEFVPESDSALEFDEADGVGGELPEGVMSSEMGSVGTSGATAPLLRVEGARVGVLPLDNG